MSIIIEQITGLENQRHNSEFMHNRQTFVSKIDFETALTWILKRNQLYDTERKMYRMYMYLSINI